jgi:hypothetical protein
MKTFLEIASDIRMPGMVRNMAHLLNIVIMKDDAIKQHSDYWGIYEEESEYYFNCVILNYIKQQATSK